MKYFITSLLIAYSLMVTGQNTNDNYFVSDLNHPEEIKLTVSVLNILAKEYAQTTDFSELKIQKVSDHYVLLAKDQSKKWIYAFELKNNDSKLYIDIDKHINACESEILSISVFTIDKEEIVGCVKYDHHVSGRN